MKVTVNLKQPNVQNPEVATSIPLCFSLSQSCNNPKIMKCKVGYTESNLKNFAVCSNCYFAVKNLSSVDYSDMMCEFEQEIVNKSYSQTDTDCGNRLGVYIKNGSEKVATLNRCENHQNVFTSVDSSSDNKNASKLISLSINLIDSKQSKLKELEREYEEADPYDGFPTDQSIALFNLSNFCKQNNLKSKYLD